MAIIHGRGKIAGDWKGQKVRVMKRHRHIGFLLKAVVAIALLGLVWTQISIYDHLVLTFQQDNTSTSYRGKVIIGKDYMMFRHADGWLCSYGNTPGKVEISSPDGASLACPNGGYIPLDATRFFPGDPVLLHTEIGLVTRMSNLHLQFLGAGALLFFFVTIILSLRWLILMKAQGLTTSFWQAWRLTYVGYFCNNFLPGMIGGDLAKILLLAQASGERTLPPLTVVIDRALGLGTLILMAAILVLPSTERFYTVAIVLYASILVLSAGVLVISVMWKKGARSWLANRGTWLQLDRLMTDLRIGIGRYRSNKRSLVLAAGLAVLSHVVIVTIFYCCAAAIGITNVPLATYFFTIPIISIVTALPISPQGWGTAELTAIYILGMAGFDPTEAVSLPLLYRFILLFWSLLGGVFLLQNLPKGFAIKETNP